jgi:succinate dehydrogenase / fumarate reductase, flavoprotein subunit
MGGVRVDAEMRSSVPHLYAAGEAVGGANGANRLSGNAISEALVFGRRAGERAAALAAKTTMPPPAPPATAAAVAPRDINPAAEIVRLQRLMNEHVGPLRNARGLERALAHVRALTEACTPLPRARAGFDSEWLDRHDLRNMRLVAECITRAAIARTESRGAHQRDDFAQSDGAWQRHQRLRLAAEGLRLES